ncbi:unnamed protein product, partial [Meganyctiphanes norvegica]
MSSNVSFSLTKAKIEKILKFCKNSSPKALRWARTTYEKFNTLDFTVFIDVDDDQYALMAHHMTLYTRYEDEECLRCLLLQNDVKKTVFLICTALIEMSNDMYPPPRKQKLATLADKTKNQLQDLLKNKFPNGLTVNELIGAYRGFYGATLQDLDPLQYGYCSLKELLQAQNDIVSLKYCGGEVMIYCIESLTNSYNQDNEDILVENTAHLEVKPCVSLPAVDAVEPGASYKTLNLQQLFQVCRKFDFVSFNIFKNRMWLTASHSTTKQCLLRLLEQSLRFFAVPLSLHYYISSNVIIGHKNFIHIIFKKNRLWYKHTVRELSDRLFFNN